MAFEGSKTLTEQIVNYLSSKIVKGQLAPGKRIYETELAKELDVSRTPVREALRVLEKNRLIESLPHRGARVTDLSSSSVGWIFDVMEGLGVILVRKAAAVRREQGILNMRRVMTRLHRNAETGHSDAYYKDIFDLLLEIRGIVENPVLNDLITDIEPSMRRTLHATISGRSNNLIHIAQMAEDIVAAIEAKDAEGAGKAMRVFLQQERELALRLFDEKEQRADNKKFLGETDLGV